MSRICLGTMMFGAADCTPNESYNMVRLALHMGVNFFDTADVYNAGSSERYLGAALSEVREREELVVASKVGNPYSTDANGGGLSRKHIIEGCRASLKRLGLGYLDILYLHHDRGGRVEEVAGALDTLIQAGDVLYAGLSNFAGYRIAEFAAALGGKLVAIQPNYSIASRLAEREVIPAAAHFGLGVVTYSPLARGVLTGKYAGTHKDNPPKGSRASRDDHHRDRLLAAELRPESASLMEKIAGRKLSVEESVTLAVQWVLENRYVSSCIVGPRTLDQLAAYLKTDVDPMPDSFRLAVDRHVAPGHNSTHNFIDPQHPVTGR